MEIKEENKEILQKENHLLNEKITSNNEINLNQISNNQSSTTIETYQQQNQTNYSDSKLDLGENNINNSNMDEKENIEDYQSTIKITNKIVKVENPSTEKKLYEKKIISRIITKESPTETTIIKTSNIINNKNLSQNHNKATYTLPLPKGKNNNNKNLKNNKKKNILPKISLNKNSNSNLNLNMPYKTYRNSCGNYNRDKYNNDLASSQSFAGNKLYLNKPEILNNFPLTYRSHSPEPGKIKRKTICRGEEIKNVQITHIICSKKPVNFHITEKLETDNIKTNPIKISKTDREKLKNVGKTSFSSSCQENVKPKIKNLKGTVTVYQHARGIGMTNDRKGNVNPLFYNSEIKKLEPIVKEKEKVKVEYIENFRSKNKRNLDKKLINSTRVLNNGINNKYQNKNYNTEINNKKNIINSNKVNKIY